MKHNNKFFKKFAILAPLALSSLFVINGNANASASIYPYAYISCSGIIGNAYGESQTLYYGNDPNNDLVAAVVDVYVWDYGIGQWLFSGRDQTPWEYTAATASVSDGGAYLNWVQAWGSGWWWEYKTGITTPIPWQSSPMQHC